MDVFQRARHFDRILTLWQSFWFSKSASKEELANGCMQINNVALLFPILKLNGFFPKCRLLHVFPGWFLCICSFFLETANAAVFFVPNGFSGCSATKCPMLAAKSFELPLLGIPLTACWLISYIERTWSLLLWVTFVGKAGRNSRAKRRALEKSGGEASGRGRLEFGQGASLLARRHGGPMVQWFEFPAAQACEAALALVEEELIEADVQTKH